MLSNPPFQEEEEKDAEGGVEPMAKKPVAILVDESDKAGIQNVKDAEAHMERIRKKLPVAGGV